MPIKVYKPTTPGRRKSSVNFNKDLASSPFKPLTKGRPNAVGRGRAGRITVRHRGGGSKRLYRVVDFLQDKAVPASVEQLEYDPYRTGYLALLKYADGERRYILAEASMKAGQSIEFGTAAAIRPGNRLPVGSIPAGTSIHNIQLTPTGRSTLVRSAGSNGSVVSHERERGATQIKLPSGEVRRVVSVCLATIGTVSNPQHENVRIGKAGRSRHRGIRPYVRGKAMNPVDHPHGGGEGGAPIGLKGPKTPSGLYTLGRKTRRGARPKSVIRSRQK